MSEPPVAPATPTGSSPRARRVITVSSKTRKSISLSAEEDLLVRRTSHVLSQSSGVVETVLTQSELNKLRKFGSKYLGHRRSHKTEPAENPDSNVSPTTDEIAVDEMLAPINNEIQEPPWLVSLRKSTRRIIKSSWFRLAVYLVVLIDMVALAMDNEYVSGSALPAFDVACTLLLLLEVVIRSLAFGLFSSPSSYFRKSRYRILNVILLLMSLLSHLGGSSSSWKVMRGLKTARSLTLYSGLRRILKALLRAVPFLANVGTLSLFGLLAFSIFGYEAYNGAYDSQCAIEVTNTASDESAVLAALPRVFCASNSTCTANDQFCYNIGSPTKNVNFDLGWRSLYLVFLVVAQDGWVTDIMEPVVEATSVASILFFAAIVGSMVFLVVNLFVAVITTAFMNFTVDDETHDPKARSMCKMDPSIEETHVNMIMGATLVLEESILASERKGSTDTNTAVEVTTTALETLAEDAHTARQFVTTDQHGLATSTELTIANGSRPKPLKVRPTSAPASKPTSPNAAKAEMLKRTHLWHSVRNMTVNTTIHLIQNGFQLENYPHGAFPVGQIAGALAADPMVLLNTAADITTAQLLHEREGTMPMRDNPAIVKLPAFIDTATPEVTASTDALVLASKNRDNHANPAASKVFIAFQRFVLSKKFDDAITVCIFVNTIFLLLEYEGMSSTLSSLLSVTEYLFGAIFFLEMTLRIIAMNGVRNYLHSTERAFDMVVVVCTSVNILLNNVSSSGYSGLHSASSLRTLRVGRLMMKYEGTRKLIESIMKSSRGVVDVVVFMLLFQVINSIIGMQIFGGSHLVNGDDIPRWNFDTFGRSFLTLLQVTTGDQWSSIAYDAVNSTNPHWFMVPFLIFNFIFGQYVLLNLFIAVILENFSISDEEAYQLQLAQIIAVPKELDIYEKIEEVGVRAFGEMEQLDNVSNVKVRMFLGLDDHHRGQPNADDSGTSSEHQCNPGGSSGRYRYPGIGYRSKSRMMLSCLPCGEELADRWAHICGLIATNEWFSRLVQVMILISCICLVLDDPHPQISSNPPTAEFTKALKVTNQIVLVVLIIEFIVKVGAAGFGFDYLRVTIFHNDEKLGYVPRQAYMENKWNQLDFALLILTIADEIISGVDPSISVARVFRAGRVLRPLRMLNKNSEMKAILSAVAQSLPQVGNVLAVCLIVYIIFSVVGRSLFAGKLYSCNDSDVATESECVGFFEVTPDGALALQEAAAKGVPGGAILVPRVWANARFSFDNVGAGCLTLLEMTSLKWIDKTFTAMDIAGKGLQPVTDHSTEYAAFFILYVYIGALFVIRLFVGVLVEQFQRNNGTAILTESQKTWVDLEKFILLLKPLKRVPRPRTLWQNTVYDLCQHPYFIGGVSVAILLNVLLLLVSPSAKTESSGSFAIIEIIFLVIFTLEAVLKCVGMRQYYLLQPNGAFEVLILSGSLVAYFFATGYHSIIQAGRIFRMMRVLRFVNLNRGVYTVFQTFRASLRPIGQIFFLMFLIFFIFATIARQLFGGVRFGPAMNHFSNFRTFGSSIMLLFQIMSGDDWHLTMTDCMSEKPFCVEMTDSSGSSYSDCGSPATAAFFFVTYVTTVVFVFLNLFIAVILENFRSCYLKSDVCSISPLDFEKYREVFMRFDKHGNGVFPLWQLPSFLAELPVGLRVDVKTQRSAFLQIRAQAQAQLECAREARRRPYFNELLRIICIHQMGIRSLPYEQQRDRVKQIFIFRSKVARMLIDSVVRGYIHRFRMRRLRRRALDAQRALKQCEQETQTDENTGEDEIRRTDSGSLVRRENGRWVRKAAHMATQTLQEDEGSRSNASSGDEFNDKEQRRHSNKRHRHREGCRHDKKHNRKAEQILPDLSAGNVNAEGSAFDIAITQAAVEQPTTVKNAAVHLPPLQEQSVGNPHGAEPTVVVPKRMGIPAPPSSKVVPAE